jgi:hypothetical protein
MADSNQAYLDDVRAMATDLWDLEFQAEANESHPKWNEVNDCICIRHCISNSEISRIELH